VVDAAPYPPDAGQRSESAADVRRLSRPRYQADDLIAPLLYLADWLGKQVVAEDPARTGKTHAKSACSDRRAKVLNLRSREKHA
jgi:hypothetical protein